MTTYISKETIERLVKDIKNIKKNPLHENGIFYEHDDSNILKGYALIIGPKNTPYNFGYYLFSIDFPSDYPYKPPIFNYHTNDGYTRFHPNLYISGKVCVSILNTWKGEQWTSSLTLSSILLTICSLLDELPLINEPGITYKHKDNKNYNEIITYKNFEVALMNILTKKLNYEWFDKFEKIIIDNFKKNYYSILEIIESKEKECKNFNEIQKNIITTGVYNLSCNLNYNRLKQNLKKIYFNLNNDEKNN